MYNMKQERTLVITEHHIYTFKSKSKLLRQFQQKTKIELRRKIPIDKIGGITLSRHPKSQELVVHI